MQAPQKICNKIHILKTYLFLWPIEKGKFLMYGSGGRARQGPYSRETTEQIDELLPAPTVLRP